MKQITKDWLNRAQDDLDVVAEIIDIEHLTNATAFHCQQTIEKSFKAILEERGELIPKIHNLIRLHNLVKGMINFAIDEIFLKEISDIYIDTRYPGDLGLLPYGKPSIEDAKRFYDFAKNIYSNVKSLLKSGTIYQSG